MPRNFVEELNQLDKLARSPLVDVDVLYDRFFQRYRDYLLRDSVFPVPEGYKLVPINASDDVQPPPPYTSVVLEYQIHTTDDMFEQVRPEHAEELRQAGITVREVYVTEDDPYLLKRRHR
jgi:hypothetical protein